MFTKAWATKSFSRAYKRQQIKFSEDSKSESHNDYNDILRMRMCELYTFQTLKIQYLYTGDEPPVNFVYEPRSVLDPVWILKWRREKSLPLPE
jgi:hypothetical protein